jgi:XTP/dITP diphosphohydrolase
MRTVLASGNRAKLEEMVALLAPLHIVVVPQSTYAIRPPEETGLSFVENAIIKARHASRLSGLAAIADDSGIVVDALRGAPGIYSARYAGVGASDEANLRKLLEDLAPVPDGERGARYECVIAYLRHAEDPVPIVCSGTWRGEVLREPRGRNGFGYDPIFYLPGQGCSCAELLPEVKNALSHRGQAMRKLLESLREGD